MTARTGNTIGAILLLALFTALGVRSSLAVTGMELTRGQHAVTLLQWWYAVLGLLTIVGLLARHTGTRLAVLAWAAIFVTRNVLAPVYFGGKGAVGAVAGGAIGLAIAFGVVYLAYRALGPAPDGSAA